MFVDNEISKPLRVKIQRSDPESISEFEIPRIVPMSVLDALLAVQREQDASIGFRFSCRVAMCGTCTVRVNGRSVLACQTAISPDQETLEVGPLAGLPVIRDLIVDTTPFWDQWERVIPYMVPKEGLDKPAQVEPASKERQSIDSSLDCIQCGACYSSCGFSSQDNTFIGPAAVNRAMVLINDSRDDEGRLRLDLVTKSDGVDRCHFMYGCSSVCPKGLDPAKAIRKIRTGRVKNR
jgi:succinate dehydrogenase / fumarate reductase iron-sulfur subunit/fumarate reductase iron-sulfur subunit